MKKKKLSEMVQVTVPIFFFFYEFEFEIFVFWFPWFTLVVAVVVVGRISIYSPATSRSTNLRAVRSSASTSFTSWLQDILLPSF